MTRVRVGVLISGRGSNLGALIAAAQAPDYPAEIACVISNRPAAPGLAVAREAGVPAVAIDHRAFGGDRTAHEQAVDAALRQHRVDLVAMAGYLRVLTPDFIAAWTGRMVNVHPSLLPRHPGLDTHARALAAGDAEHGCTVHWVTEDVDAGPVIGQARVAVRSDDDAASLGARVLAAEHTLYPACLARAAEAVRAATAAS